MEYIRDWKQFNNLFTPRKNYVIIYGFGEVAHTVLNYLYYKNMLEDTLVCVAINDKEDTLSTRHLEYPVWPDRYNDIDIVDYHELPHFRTDTNVLVCTSENKHNEINMDLTEFGFRKILFISDEFAWCLRIVAKEIEQDMLFKIDFKLNELGKCLADLKYRVEQKQEIVRVNTAAFDEYKNAFKDRDVVIVATGPTLKDYQPIPGAVHIGVNFAYRKADIPLDFLFLMDGYNIRENIIQENGSNDLIQGVGSIKERIFIGRLERRSIYEHYQDLPIDYDLMNKKCKPYKADYYLSGTIYSDITSHALMHFRTTVFCAIQFALFTNPKRIFIVGCDVSDKGHFYKDDKDKLIKCGKINSPMLKLGWLRIKKFARQHYPNTEIVSINPVGLRGLFKDVYTDGNKNVI